MRGSHPIKLSIPDQTRDSPSFCDGSAEEVDAWAEELHGLDPVEAAGTLLKGVTELNACRTPIELRFRQLEAVRPVIHFVCTQVTRAKLIQPLLLGRKERRSVVLCQTLQNQLASGYKIVLVSGIRQKVGLADPSRDPEAAGALVVTALHRALTDLSHTLLRALQLYAPPPARLWQQLHQLYHLGDVKQVLEFRVRDPSQRTRPETAVDDAYLRALLLGSARPNMLRQASMSLLFSALEEWSDLVTLSRTEDSRGSFLLVDLNGDAPPVEATRYHHRENEDLRRLDTAALLQVLRAYLDGSVAPQEAELTRPGGPELLAHVVKAWGSNARRSFNRIATSGGMEVCVGLPAVHYHSAGGIPLQAQLRDRRQVPRETPDALELDPFAGAGDVGGARLQDPARLRRKPAAHPSPADPDYPVSRPRLADASPGGYGLVWDDEVDRELATGELVGIREPGDTNWSIAVVRWCRNEPGDLRVGVEMLAPRAMTACVRPVKTHGSDSDWSPALVLPEIAALTQPAYLITRRDGFEPGQKVALNQFGTGLRARLEELERLTHSFSEFRFQELGGSVDPAPSTGIEVDYLEDGDDA